MSKEELLNTLPLANDYIELKIPKKRGGFRTLMIPSPELKKVQRKILRFLRKIFDVHYGNIHGLRSGSYVGHAKRHCRYRFLFSFDIQDAFPSVNVSQLEGIIYKRLSKIRTYKSIKIFTLDIVTLEKKTVSEIRPRSALEAEELSTLIIKLTTFNRTLPQGAPTSPFLFYLSLTETKLFKDLWVSLPGGYEMTCYTDNFVISGQKPLPYDEKEKISRFLERFGFKVNPKKVHEFDCRQGAPLITGVRVDGKGRICLPKKTIRKWRGIIHRAALETDLCSRTDLSLKIEGFIASLKPIYGENLPPQIKKPYLLFKQNQNKPA